MGSSCSATASEDSTGNIRALATHPTKLGDIPVDTRRLSLHTASGASRSTAGDTTQESSESPLPTNFTSALGRGSSTTSDIPPHHETLNRPQIVAPLSTSFSQHSVQNPIAVTSMTSEQTPNSAPGNSSRGIQPRRWSAASMSKDSEIGSTSTHSSRFETGSQQHQTPTMNVRPPIGPSSSSKGPKKRNRVALSSFSSVLTKEEADVAEESIKAASSNTFTGAACPEVISAGSVATEDDRSPTVQPSVETVPTSNEWQSIGDCRELGSPGDPVRRHLEDKAETPEGGISTPFKAKADWRTKLTQGPLVSECSGSNLSLQHQQQMRQKDAQRGTHVCVPGLLPPLASWSHEHDGQGSDPMDDGEGFLSMARVNSESFDSAKRSCDSERHY